MSLRTKEAGPGKVIRVTAGEQVIQPKPEAAPPEVVTPKEPPVAETDTKTAVQQRIAEQEFIKTASEAYLETGRFPWMPELPPGTPVIKVGTTAPESVGKELATATGKIQALQGIIQTETDIKDTRKAIVEIQTAITAAEKLLASPKWDVDSKALADAREWVQDAKTWIVSAETSLPERTAYAKVITNPKLSPFVTKMPDGSFTVDVRSAILAGVDPELIQKAGYSQSDIKQAEALKSLLKFKKGEGYDLVKAISAGEIATVRAAGFDNLTIAESQIAVSDTRSKAKATKDLKVFIDKDGVLDLRAAADADVPPATIRQAGYDVSNEDWKAAKTPPPFTVTGVLPPADSGLTQEAYQRLGLMLEYGIDISPDVSSKEVMAKWDSLGALKKNDIIQSSSGFREGFRLATISMMPGYGTVYFWDEMSTAWKIASVAGDVLFVAGLFGAPGKVWKGLKFLNADETGSWFRRTGPALDNVIEIKGGVPRMLNRTTVISPSEIGMTEAQFSQFKKARLLNPQLSPSDFTQQEQMWADLARQSKALDADIARQSKIKVPSKIPTTSKGKASILEALRTQQAKQRALATKVRISRGKIESLSKAKALVEEAARNDAMWLRLVEESLSRIQPVGRAAALSSVEIKVIASTLSDVETQMGTKLTPAQAVGVVGATLTQTQIQHLHDMGLLSKVMAALKVTPTASPAEKAAVKAAVAMATTPSTTTDPAVKISPSTKVAQVVTPKPALAPAPTPTPAPTPVVAPALTGTPMPKVPTTKVPTTKVPPKALPPRPRLGPSSSDSDKRKVIKKAKGAVAFRMGEVGKAGKRRDVWHVIMYPYQSQDDYVSVVGKTPAGAVVARGKGSAYRTAHKLTGKMPGRSLMMDIGAMDATLAPGAKQIGISFRPDPKLLTTGDITITKRTRPITGRRATRITRKMPRLR